MRKYKATICVNKKGRPVSAQAEGHCLIDPGEGTAEDGWICLPMKKRSSRQKGNNLEIEVAKAFSKWLYGRDDVLRRTPLSGGWGSGKLGDITLDPSMAEQLKLIPPNLYIECKNHADLLDQGFWRWLATGRPDTITKWVLDTKQKAHDRMWFLVLKGINTDTWLLTDAKQVGLDINPIKHVAVCFNDLGHNMRYAMMNLRQLDALSAHTNMCKDYILGKPNVATTGRREDKDGTRGNTKKSE